MIKIGGSPHRWKRRVQWWPKGAQKLFAQVLPGGESGHASTLFYSDYYSAISFIYYLIMSLKIWDVMESLAHRRSKSYWRRDLLLLHTCRYPWDLKLIRFSVFSDIRFGHQVAFLKPCCFSRSVPFLCVLQGFTIPSISGANRWRTRIKLCHKHLFPVCMLS